MATVLEQNEAVNADYCLGTSVLRKMVRRWGLERGLGKPVEKLSRYQLLNALTTRAVENGLLAADGNGGGNGSGIDESAVRRLIAQHAPAAGGPTATLVIKQPGKADTKLCGTMHKALPDVLRLVSAGVPVLLVGPAGSGKTYLAGQVARALALPFSFNSLSAGCTESHIIGRVLPDEHGNWTYRPSPFAKAYKDGGVHLFDELDAADPNLLVLINAALANGHLSIPITDSPPIKRNDRCVVIAAANTFGHGANAQYVGRNQLDAATLDRFSVSTIYMGYDQEMERTLVGSILDDARTGLLTCWAWGVRGLIEQHQLRRIMSTRTIVNAARLIAAGDKLAAVRDRYFASWSADEREIVS